MTATRRSSNGGGAAAAVPEWVTTLARRQRTGDDDSAIAVSFIASKRVEKSDLVSQQNRLYLPTDFVVANLFGLLSEEERAMANLVDDIGGPSRRSRTEAEEEEMTRKPKAAGRAHGGLPVRVYARCGFVFYLRLTRWNGSGGTVIKGDELKLFLTFSALKKGDKIDVWAFRRGGELCFIIGRP
ncbi:B3 domain-containing protein At1g05920-like [Zingiber officinale]|uniref:B3 domain-containing protein At1g05920-like n=1 Tax=Zingiber officinale TaxID=94328 RepID=UPI001C4C5CDD|nr:B3 domain-containing protein At1g05920-like [Zingiber officinale]